ncbi:MULTISPECIES: HD family phosphohydrolase [Pontibacillus]|uniref:HD family phosphohydrolase n=1 Tax=Pontibacillus chungwhensis TaxID=265426 RepID=A0ABY8UTH7_9BACI|nr:HD family phosphohydrolase [Pontibacillus chungwhensis]MCD5323613.1 HD family phosphohydrolase [Pontibacillus sp. HN14]WIF96981.1 HD family phosphohydrolase [Pontibacillus chungwhensis]
MRNWWNQFIKGNVFQNLWVTTGASLAILALVMFLLAFSNVQTKTYDVKRLDTAKDTILSPVNVEDKDRTQEKRDEAMESVEDVYTIRNFITNTRINYMEEIFNAVRVVESQNDEKDKDSEALEEQKSDVAKLQSMLSEDITKQVDKEVLKHLLQAPADQRNVAEEMLQKALTDVLRAGVREEGVEEARKEVLNELQFSSFDPSLKEAVQSLTEFLVVRNSFIDEDKKIQAQNEAANDVEPVMIRQGQVLVFQGETISNDVYERLELVGLLDGKNNWYPYTGLIVVIILSLGILFYELRRMKELDQLDHPKVLAVLFISILVFLLMKVGSLFQTSIDDLYYAVPVAAGAMLLKLLIHERIAVFSSVLFAVFGTIFFNDQIPGTLNVEAGIYFLFSQLAAIIFLHNVKDKTSILKTGFGVTVVNMLLVSAFVMLTYEPISVSNLAITLGYAVLAAFLSSVLTFGLLPFFEAGLGMLSDTLLITLSNPNHPLLRKILTQTPGTYHHSVMVANLSEAACEAVGANGLLARVGAYYHDLGKTSEPQYFIENQMGMKNPHDELKPHKSAEIIISHPYIGAEMLRKHKMPEEIIAIAEQHHGTTLLKYFYHKAKQGDEDVQEDLFRYPGPKPQSSEAAIVCICDSVEAAVRSMKSPSPEDIENLVHSIIIDRLLDGQLSDSPLTLKDLERIQTAICETLQGIFHSRIQYPETKAAVKEA